MNTIISALHFPWTDIDECFTRVKNEFQLDGVELSFHESFRRPHCTKDDIEAITASREKHGIKVYAHIWENLATLGVNAAREKLVFWQRLSKRAGVSGLVIHGGSYPDQREGIDRAALALAKVIPAFERSRIEFYLENHYAYDYKDCHELFSEVWEFMELFHRIQSPSLRFCFDTGHANLTKNGEELILGLASYLSHVHLADNHGERDDHCMYGAGTVPWERYFAALAKISFNGTFCVEFPVREDRRPFYACARKLQQRF